MRSGSRVTVNCNLHQLKTGGYANFSGVIVPPAFGLINDAGSWWRNLDGFCHHVYMQETGEILFLNKDWLAVERRPSVLEFLTVLIWQAVYFLAIHPLLILPFKFPQVWERSVRSNLFNVFVGRGAAMNIVSKMMTWFGLLCTAAGLALMILSLVDLFLPTISALAVFTVTASGAVLIGIGVVIVGVSGIMYKHPGN